MVSESYTKDMEPIHEYRVSVFFGKKNTVHPLYYYKFYKGGLIHLNQDVVAELHEFANGYEAELKEVKTGAKAYEVMVYKNGGQIKAEMAPNIIWNTKYGPINWGNSGACTVSEEQATKSAQEFVTKRGQGYSIEKPELAPGRIQEKGSCSSGRNCPFYY